jgi:hypothetical protein
MGVCVRARVRRRHSSFDAITRVHFILKKPTYVWRLIKCCSCSGFDYAIPACMLTYTRFVHWGSRDGPNNKLYIQTFTTIYIKH